MNIINIIALWTGRIVLGTAVIIGLVYIIIWSIAFCKWAWKHFGRTALFAHFEWLYFKRKVNNPNYSNLKHLEELMEYKFLLRKKYRYIRGKAIPFIEGKIKELKAKNLRPLAKKVSP